MKIIIGLTGGCFRVCERLWAARRLNFCGPPHGSSVNGPEGRKINRLVWAFLEALVALFIERGEKALGTDCGRGLVFWAAATARPGGTRQGRRARVVPGVSSGRLTSVWIDQWPARAKHGSRRDAIGGQEGFLAQSFRTFGELCDGQILRKTQRPVLTRPFSGFTHRATSPTERGKS